jgi:hypothetical protein
VDADAQNESLISDVALGVTLNVPMEGGKTLILQTGISRDAPLHEQQALMEKLVRFSEREEWKVHVVNLKAVIEKDKHTLDAMKSDFIRVQTDSELNWKHRGKKGEPELTPEEQRNRSNLLVSMKAQKGRIEDNEKLLCEIEAKLAKEE